MLEVREVFQVVIDLDLTLLARYVAGSLNVVADSLSMRGQVLSNEWSLSQAIFRRVCRVTGLPLVDLFATHWNKKLPLFVSLIKNDQALTVDALTYPWRGYGGPLLLGLLYGVIVKLTPSLFNNKTLSIAN